MLASPGTAAELRAPPCGVRERRGAGFMDFRQRPVGRGWLPTSSKTRLEFQL